MCPVPSAVPQGLCSHVLLTYTLHSRDSSPHSVHFLCHCSQLSAGCRDGMEFGTPPHRAMLSLAAPPTLPITGHNSSDSGLLCSCSPSGDGSRGGTWGRDACKLGPSKGKVVPACLGEQAALSCLDPRDPKSQSHSSSCRAGGSKA